MSIPAYLMGGGELLLALTQDEVLKGISSGVNGDDSGTSMRAMAVLLALSSVTIAIAVLLNWRQKKRHPDGELNDPGALVQEVADELDLSKAQVRQLQILQKGLQEQGTPLQSPLALMLCPSLIQRLKVEQVQQVSLGDQVEQLERRPEERGNGQAG